MSALITERVNRAGVVSEDGALAGRGVTAAHYVDATHHSVAAPFWAFMQSSGMVWEQGGTTTAPLFQDPFYATGYPIAEAYWATVEVGGTARDVLMQCFERRCLTYTPDNPVEWQVEAGNVGTHYYAWRYPEAHPGPNAEANQLAAAITRAADDSARKQALMEVFAALNIGVYAGDGTMLLGGAERSAEDFYLYDLEAEMLAGAIGRGQTFGIIDLAMQLTTMELLPEGEIVDPEAVRQALLRGVAAAEADPNGFTSLSPLIVRQLGMFQPQPYDLFEDVPLDTIRMDPLAFFLVLADIAVPLIADKDVEVGATSNLIANSNGIAKMTFHPRAEEDPGEGWVVEEQGIVTGVALYQSKFTNLLGSYGQYLTPKSGSTRWVVTRHEQPGYNVTLTVEYDVHLHDYPTPPMYPHDHDYSASGEVTYKIFVPDGSIKPPYVETPIAWTQVASGSGEETTVTVGNGWGGDYQCSGAFSGQWMSYAEVEDDGAKSRGERLRYIRFRPEQPDDANYTGNCDDGHLWFDSYTNADTYPWIDLQATGTTTKEYDPCPTTHSSDITCEGNITWTIEVEWGGFGS